MSRNSRPIDFSHQLSDRVVGVIRRVHEGRTDVDRHSFKHREINTASRAVSGLQHQVWDLVLGQDLRGPGSGESCPDDDDLVNLSEAGRQGQK